MAVPTRAEALSLLLSAEPSPRLLRHVTVVAEVAAFLAHRADRAGVSVDRRAAEAAALLHDVDKALPRDHPLRRHGHGPAGAALVSEAGFPELARAIAVHPVTTLTRPEAEAWALEAPILERIVSYADKRATQRVVSLDKRFARWQRRHPEHRDRLDAALAVARTLEGRLCAELAIVPADVERLRWVDEALGRARSSGSIELAAIGVVADRAVAAASTSSSDA